MCVYIYIYVISELHSVERQSNLPMHLQQDRFHIKSKRNRRVFAWRHLEAGQYVAQSGLHLHQSETHSCKGNEKKSCQELRNASGFTISLSSPSIAFNKIYYGIRNRYNKIYRRQETNSSVFRIFMIKTGKWQIALQYWKIF